MEELLDDIFPENEGLFMKRNRISTRVMLGQLIFAFCAIFLACYSILTIVLTGPMASFIGIVVFGFSSKLKYYRRMAIGISMPIFSAICFSLIYFLDWTKREAYVPIIALMVCYTIGLSFLVLIELKKNRKNN